MENNFLDENNFAGQTILRIVSRGNSIIAELLRLSDNIPSVLLENKEALDNRETVYQEILFDFSYFKSPEAFDRKVESNTVLADAEYEFQDSHGPALSRFYNLFQSIIGYYEDLNKYLDDLRNNSYMQYTVEDVMLNVDGKQLICESAYLFGCMLIFLDMKIPGYTRERIVVSHYRTKGEFALKDVEEVTKLCRSTGFTPHGKRPANYPEEFFGRFALPEDVVGFALDRLRSDDIYNQIRKYPSPDHRSTALATQGAMLYVILYFSPGTLKGQNAMMREVVDKHFNDNWIITIYMGCIVNLREWWAPYKAAKLALDNTITFENVNETHNHCKKTIKECEEVLKQYLSEGILQEKYVLDHISSLLNSLRNCNTTLRWLMLHRRATLKKFMDVLLGPNSIPAGKVVDLLLQTSQLEYKLKDIFRKLLNNKEDKWNTCKNSSSERMKELAEYFSGPKNLSKVKEDKNLQNWFKVLGEEIDALDFSVSKATKTGRKIQKIIQALTEVEQFEAIDTSLQIKEFLSHSREYLMQMVQAVGVKDEVMEMLETISDLSYGWELLDDYIPILHERVKKEPQCVVLVRAMFLKMASILDIPLVRIVQAGSEDTISVAEYYSGELVNIVRRALSIVPRSVFTIMNTIIDLQTSKMRSVPIKLELVAIKDFAQLNQRYELAKATHEISMFTEGILAMEKTLLGVIQVEPKVILSDGIRCELVNKLSSVLNEILVFNSTSKKIPEMSTVELETILGSLAAKMTGFKRSFEYAQDYIGIYGLKMWQEEYSRIINFNVERECNRFLKKKVLASLSEYQSKTIPIPQYASSDKKSYNFMGRLSRALLVLTDPRITIYAPECSGWYKNAGEEIAGLGLFALLNNAIGLQGLFGLDKLLSFRLVNDLRSMLDEFKVGIESQKEGLNEAERELYPSHSLPQGGMKPYTTSPFMKKMGKLTGSILEQVLRIGQVQLLRRHIANELYFACKLDSNLLFNALDNLNNSLIKDVNEHYRNESNPYPEVSNPALSELSKYLDGAGMNDPFTKIYITTAPLDGFALLLLYLVINNCEKLIWNQSFSSLIAKKASDGIMSKGLSFPIDGAPLVVGIATVLKQLHPSVNRQFFGLLGQYIRCNVQTSYAKPVKPSNIPPEVMNLLLFADQYCKFSKISRKEIEYFIPAYLFNTMSL